MREDTNVVRTLGFQLNRLLTTKLNITSIVISDLLDIHLKISNTLGNLLSSKCLHLVTGNYVCDNFPRNSVSTKVVML